MQKLKWTKFDLSANQQTAIERFVRGNDVLAGSGKSICYQLLPHTYEFLGVKDACVLVVSPLLSLMQDQAMSLENLTKVALLCSEYPPPDNLSDCPARFYFATPESISEHYQDMWKKEPFASRLVAYIIDEAHLVSEWKDFREEFVNLGSIRALLPKVNLLALTATLTPHTRKEVLKSLHFRGTSYIQSSPNCPNIKITVHHVGRTNFSCVKHIFEELKEKKEMVRTVIFNKSYNQLESLIEEGLVFLNDSKYDDVVISYASNTDPKARKFLLQSLLSSSAIRIILATSAFGLGVNISDIYRVVLLGCPRNISTIMQQIGRAGRDGSETDACIYYTTNDVDQKKMYKRCKNIFGN